MMSSRFVRFLLTGGFAALVNLGSRYLLNQYMSFEAAVAMAYLFGVVTAYLLARLFVFEKSGHEIATEFRRFVDCEHPLACSCLERLGRPCGLPLSLSRLSLARRGRRPLHRRGVADPHRVFRAQALHVPRGRH